MRGLADRLRRNQLVQWFSPLFGWLKRAGRRMLDVFPLTLRGLLALLGGVLCWRYMGAERLDQVLLIVAEVALGFVFLTMLSVLVAKLRLRRLLRRERSEMVGRAEADQLTWSGMSSSALRFTPLVKIRWEWESPESFEVSQTPSKGRLAEQFIANRRGLHTALVRRFIVEDSLGLSSLAFRLPEELSPTLRVLPNLGKLRQGAVISTLAGGDELPHPLGTVEGDRLELRRYGHGDPARLIVWKIYGRTRKLTVRTPERALARAHSVAAYIVTGERDEAAAAAARVAVETGALGAQWVLGADGVARDAHRNEEALELIAASGVRGAVDDAGGLAGFIKRNEKHGTVRFLIFAPARDGEWVDRVTAIAARRRGLLDVIIVGDGIGKKRGDRWPGLFFKHETDLIVLAEEVEAVTTKLSSRGAGVAVIDRPSGQVISLAMLHQARRVA